MDEKPVYVTRKGLKAAQEQLHRLKARLRELAGLVAAEQASWDPLEGGDRLSAVRQDLSTTEARIATLEALLADAQVIPASRSTTTAAIGSSVTVADRATGEVNAYTLVVPLDSDPEAGCISYLSPVGQGLLGKHVGEEAAIEVPAGLIKLRVTAVSPVAAGAPGESPRGKGSEGRPRSRRTRALCVREG